MGDLLNQIESGKELNTTHSKSFKTYSLFTINYRLTTRYAQAMS